MNPKVNDNCDPERDNKLPASSFLKNSFFLKIMTFCKIYFFYLYFANKLSKNQGRIRHNYENFVTEPIMGIYKN